MKLVRPHKHVYTPTAVTIERSDHNDRCDIYRGTLEELSAAGLAPADLFPGQPGMPISVVTLWPRDLPCGSSWREPGILRLHKLPSGRFTAALQVSNEEQERRGAQVEAEAEAQRARNEAEAMARRTERLLAAMADEDPGRAAHVRRGAERYLRAGRPRRSSSHLRLVWTAPAAGGAA